jgi:hypothetical protein
MRAVRSAVVLVGFAIVGASCPGDAPTSIDGDLAIGTWGGDNAALILDPVTAHVHVGCTGGDFPAPVELDAEGRFSVSGSYALRVYPVPVGPTLPAQFSGALHGKRLTLTIAVNDTVQKELVILGPVTVTLGKEPRMQMCPICVRSAERRALSVERRGNARN